MRLTKSASGQSHPDRRPGRSIRAAHTGGWSEPRPDDEDEDEDDEDDSGAAAPQISSSGVTWRAC